MDFNIAPYYDDFEETKQFYKILFRPGVAVQTREVNQLQSILQNQVTKVGDHLFKEGSMVIPGQVNYNNKLKYLKVSSVNIGDWALSDLENQIISNSNGLTAQVIKTIDATDTTPITLVLLYIQNNQDTETLFETEFVASSTLYVVDDNTKTIAVSAGIVSGRSVAAAIQQGVYYLAGHFVTVPSQVVSVKTYADTMSDINARIGIQYTESIVTSTDDSTLTDNALGSPNYAAPGAHRYKIDVEFVQVGLDETPVNFFELIRVEEGVLQSLVNASQYNILEETLARRTFDESGNYVVDDFKFDIREERNSDRGNWTPSVQYLISDIVTASSGRKFTCLQAGGSGTTEPADFSNTAVDESSTIADGTTLWRYTANPVSNRGVNQNGSSSNLVATFGIGKAYVQGYEINKLTNSDLTIPKSRDTVSINNQSITLDQGTYVYLDSKYILGAPDISTGPIVALYDRFYYKGAGNKFGMGNQVGTARIGWAEPDPRGFLRVGLNNIVMNADKGFTQAVNSLVVYDTTTSVAATSYTLTNLIKYAGGSTSSFLQISGVLGTSSQAAGAMTVSGFTTTAWLNELKVGDVLTLGTSSHATTSTWTVTAISAQNVMTLTGSPLTGAASTSVFVRLPVQGVLGVGTGIGTRFQSEYRVGDTIWMGVATGSSTLTSMVVTNIISETRMLVSSAAARMIANTAHGTYYASRAATFVGDIGGNYQLGINSKKLTGLHALSDYSGGTTVVQSHQAIRINGSNDAKFLTELNTNDYVDINGNKLLITKISSNTVAFAINIESVVTGSTTQYPAFKIEPSINGSNYNALVFPVAPSTVDSISDNTYTAYKTTAVTVSVGATQAVLSLAAASGNDAAEAAPTTDPNAFYVAQNAVSTLGPPLPITGVSYSGPGGTITLTFPATSASSIRVTYPVTRSASGANVLGRLRTKTLTFNAYDTFLTTSAATQAILKLSKADIYRKVKIYMATTFVAAWDSTVQANATDVTSRYELDSGQRPYVYDGGTVRLIAGFPQATGSIRVYYDYFEHGAGDYFAKSSYNLPVENIPSYNNISLANVLDFRTKVDTTTNQLINSAPPRFGTSFVADVSYYLGRKEKILLDRSGKFYNISGVSGLSPQEPKTSDSDNAIPLYDLELAPYTISTEVPNVKKKKYDNRRYTMKDIGSIEKRVTNLEETTALNLLEVSAQSLQIRDNNDSTLERYKTGFFVDAFADDSNSEIGGDGRFSIDQDRKTLNPAVEYTRLPLLEKLNYTASLYTSSTAAVNKAARALSNYAITGDLLTLNYTTASVIQQLLATTSIAVAPFIVTSFLGSLRVVPDKDIYEDVSNIKAITQTIDNATPEALAAMVAQYRAHDRRPYRVETVTVESYQNTTRTSVLIPFCRANTILLVAKGMKPRTRFYPYFDDIDVAQYCTGAVKFTFDSLPFIDFEGSSPKVKTEWPRWRSLYESADVEEVVRARQVTTSRQVWQQNNWGWGGFWGWGGWNWFGGQWVTETSTSWVYDYGWFRRTLDPELKEQMLPSEANRDAYRAAMGMGTSVYYYENGICVGSGVGVHQDKTTLYLVNARGKLSPSFLRNNGSYNYSGTWYISVEGNDPKTLPTQTVTAANALTSDGNGYLYSDDSGVVVSIFDLPDTDTVKFTTGKKPITLTDDPDNDPDNWTSKADGTYYVEGYDVTFTNNYISTKNYVLRPYDPIAQSFKLPSQFTNGCFITDIDVFFSAKPVTEKSTVSLELRSCDSTGRPSATEMIPGTEVTLRPDQITVDATRGQTPTKFTFRQPVYLMPEKQYAFVLRTDSKNYRVWMATAGQTDVSKTQYEMYVDSYPDLVTAWNLVAATPGNTQTKDAWGSAHWSSFGQKEKRVLPNLTTYSALANLGSLFKSQDGTLWTEDQFSDLKFQINRAVFNTADTGADVYVVNRNMQTEQLPSNPLTFVHGSNKIRVGHRNHGFSSGDTTKLYSQYWATQYATLGSAAKIAGIPAGEIFGSYISSNVSTYRPDNADSTQPKLLITDVTYDTYTITVSSAANIAGGTTGFTALTGGGEDIFGLRSVMYSVVKPSASIIKPEPTALTFNARMVTGFTQDFNNNSTPVNYTSFAKDLNFNDYNILDTSCAILSDTVEYARLTATNINTGGNVAAWKDSFIGNLHLVSSSDHVSPAVDMSTVYIDTMQHRIDNPSYSSRLPQILPPTPGLGTSALIMMSTIVTNDATIGIDGATNRLIGSIDGVFANVVPGRYITISGSSAASNNYTSTALLVLNVSPDAKVITVSAVLTTVLAGDALTIRQIDDFTEEATNMSANGESKYITNVITLKNPATQIKLQVETCCPSAADFDIYYKTGAAGSDFNSINWAKYVAPNQVGTTSSYTNLVKSDKRNVFTDVEFNISTYDSTGVPDDLNAFTAFQIKLVMRSSNAARAPQFRNLRVIAHA